MALNRIAAPEDDQIAAVLDFAERAGDLAHLLHCQSGRAVGILCDGSTQAPTQSPSDTAVRCAFEVVSQSPKMSGYLASFKIRAALSMPSFSDAGLPSIKQAGPCRHFD